MTSPQPGEKRKAENISLDVPLDSIVNIDPDGDLVLVVGANLVGSDSTLFCVEKTVGFRVDYRALARASSVLKAKFDPKRDNHKPDTSEAGWTEHFPDDSPAGLQFLFLIAHGELSNISEKQSLQEIYEIVDMAFKYGMLSLLKGSTRSWFSGGVSSPLRLEFSTMTDAKTLAQAMTVALALGYKSLIGKVTEHIVHRGRIMNGHLNVMGEDLESPKLKFHEMHIDVWRRMRLKHLRGIHAALHSFIQKLQGTERIVRREQCPHHRNPLMEPNLCESLALGSLLKGLANLDLLPLTDFETNDTWSVFHIQESLNQIKIHGFSDTVPKKHRKYNCDWTSALQGRIQLAAKQRHTYDEKLLDNMKKRAALVGLDEACIDGNSGDN